MIRLKVKEIAQQKGISQNRLSYLSLIDGKTLRRIYHDPATSITLVLLNRLAYALNVHPCELLEYERDESLV